MKYLFLLLIFITCPLHSVLADDAVKAVYFYGCEDYESGKAFVREAIKKCSKSRYERSCLKKARDFYNYCPFNGSFKRIYSDLHSDALVVFVLAGLRAGSQKAGSD